MNLDYLDLGRWFKDKQILFCTKLDKVLWSLKKIEILVHLLIVSQLHYFQIRTSTRTVQVY